MSTSAGGNAVIEIDHLTKYYGTREIMTDMSLTVPRGCIYGFLRPQRHGQNDDDPYFPRAGGSDPGAPRAFSGSTPATCLPRREPASVTCRRATTFTAG